MSNRSPAAYTSHKNNRSLPRLSQGKEIGIEGDKSVSSAICRTHVNLRWICTCAEIIANPTPAILALFPDSINRNLEISKNKSHPHQTNPSATRGKTVNLPASTHLPVRNTLAVNSSQPTRSALTDNILPANSNQPLSKALIVKTTLQFDSPPSLSNRKVKISSKSTSVKSAGLVILADPLCVDISSGDIPNGSKAWPLDLAL
jgi:hypothetical protein